MDESVSPLSSLVRQGLLEFFVGRDAQLKDIERRVSAGHRVLAISGQPGTGKTSLARMFAERLKGHFPGGVLFVDAYLATDVDALFERAGGREIRDDSLIVLDEAAALEPESLRELRRRILSSRSTLVGISHDRAAILPLTDEVIELRGLDRAEFRELFRLRSAIAHGGFDEGIVSALFELGQGNPVVAQLAIEAVRTGIAGSWRELLSYLRDFESPGIIGPDGRPLERESHGRTRIIVDVAAANDELLRMLGRDPQLVWTLPPRRFEEIVAELLGRQGYNVSLTPASGDGGFDIYAAKKDGLGQFLYLVECKRYVPANKVGVEIVRALYGVVQAQQATAGAIVTSSYFTAGAEKYQRSVKHQLQLHDYIVLQKWLADLDFSRQANAT